jgi:hypothetical protein
MHFPATISIPALGRRLTVVLALAFTALFTTLVLLWFVSWNANMQRVPAEPIFGIGPLTSGESVEQDFEVSGRYLTGLEFFARANSEQSYNTDFIVRLYEGTHIIRQDLIQAPIGPYLESVRWDFDALIDPVSHRYRLQVVVGQDPVAPVYLMASLTDMLPGSAVTNGIPTADHVDLAVRPWREIRRLDTLGAAAASLPADYVGLAALLLSVGSGLGFVVSMMVRSFNFKDCVVWMFLGLSVGCLVLVIEFHRSGELSLPEAHYRLWPGFFRTMGLLMGAVLVAILSRPIGQMIDNNWGRPAGSPHGWRETSLIVLVGVGAVTTLAAGLAYVLSGPEIVFVKVPVYETERVMQGDVDLLGHGPALILARIATIAWIVLGGGVLLYGMSSNRDRLK